MELRHWFSTCPKGMEGLLAQELSSFGAVATRETVAGCRFEAPLAVAYRACLWSRLANRVLLTLAEFPVPDSDALYKGVAEQSWVDLMEPTSSMLVDFSGQNSAIRNTQYGAQVAKDAIADHFRDQQLERPNVSRRDPDVRVNLRLHRDRATLSLDFSGHSLHQRGYRLDAGKAPLKENLAAAILLRADWPGMAARGGALIDPMCGSGTLLLEGAFMAAGIAPGLARERWGFEYLKFHNETQWQALRSEAAAQAERGRQRQLPEIRGYDADIRMVRKAEANIARAGMEDIVRVSCKPLTELRKPTHRPLHDGLVVCNPPYGERLGDRDSLRYLYGQLGETLVREFSGWQAAVLTSDKALGQALGLRSHKQYALWNGTIATQLLLLSLDTNNKLRPMSPMSAAVEAKPSSEEKGDAVPAPELSEGAQMFANRLRKNMQHLQRWARRETVSCYRLYDADMPEYAVVVDRYDDALHVAEYRAPKGVEPEAAERRLSEVRQVLPLVTGIAGDNIYFKQRQRQRGKSQYQREDQQGQLRTVREGDVKLLVNLTDYLDTGLFLDHRPLRLRIARESRGKHLLNLFCYTATVSVHAASGGARTTTSVDLSRTYLDWARKNFSINGYDDSNHHLEQADCLVWLSSAERLYDLIVLDPPSFSNSKRMEASFDIQRDHVNLLRMAVARLQSEGVLYFSNNLRGFSLDDSVKSFCTVEDIGAATIDFDFKRQHKAHQCWRITR
jgi:23S rRNA (guanine2445-N2)-methyltransferase / 23S rRNA (guanine2069-N7)-methyltransferase